MIMNITAGVLQEAGTAFRRTCVHSWFLAESMMFIWAHSCLYSCAIHFLSNASVISTFFERILIGFNIILCFLDTLFIVDCGKIIIT